VRVSAPTMSKLRLCDQRTNLDVPVYEIEGVEVL
jgi:hypothetical protein